MKEYLIPVKSIKLPIKIDSSTEFISYDSLHSLNTDNVHEFAEILSGKEREIRSGNMPSSIYYRTRCQQQDR